jgi:cell division protein FtsB
MLRFLLGCLLVALIAIAIGWRWSRVEQAVVNDQADQISQLRAQVGKLNAENDQLKARLATVQDEQSRLARDNDDLRKILQQKKLIGELPKDTVIPYPPK